MSHPYTPTPAQITTVTLPDDGDERVAASVNTPLEQLADAIAFLQAGTQSTDVVTTPGSSTLTAPDGAFAAILVGSGGGGGGGGGSAAGADARSCGGGGGGGAREQIAVVPIVGGEDYTVVIGAGGAGGAGSDDRSPGGQAAQGASGGHTSFTRVTGTVLLAKFKGARGGLGGTTTDGAGAGQVTFAPGGPDIVVDMVVPPNNLTTVPFVGMMAAAQRGGAGLTAGIAYQNYQSGGASPNGNSGGTSGIVDDTTAGSYYGGGAGGGGGASMYGNGGGGGDASAPNNAGAATSASPGGSAGAAAGGGGGGGCGGASADGGSGGDGGDGGDGKLTVVWLLKGG